MCKSQEQINWENENPPGSHRGDDEDDENGYMSVFDILAIDKDGKLKFNL